MKQYDGILANDKGNVIGTIHKVVKVEDLRALLEGIVPSTKPPKITLKLTPRDVLYYKNGFNDLREKLLAELSEKDLDKIPEGKRGTIRERLNRMEKNQK